MLFKKIPPWDHCHEACRKVNEQEVQVGIKHCGEVVIVQQKMDEYNHRYDVNPRLSEKINGSDRKNPQYIHRKNDGKKP